MDIYTTMCEIDSLVGTCHIALEAQLGALWWPRGVGWGSGGTEVHEGGGVCIYIVDSLRCTAENNTTL